MITNMDPDCYYHLDATLCDVSGACMPEYKLAEIEPPVTLEAVGKIISHWDTHTISHWDTHTISHWDTNTISHWDTHTIYW